MRAILYLSLPHCTGPVKINTNNKDKEVNYEQRTLNQHKVTTHLLGQTSLKFHYAICRIGGGEGRGGTGGGGEEENTQ